MERILDYRSVALSEMDQNWVAAQETSRANYLLWLSSWQRPSVMQLMHPNSGRLGWEPVFHSRRIELTIDWYLGTDWLGSCHLWAYRKYYSEFIRKTLKHLSPQIIKVNMNISGFFFDFFPGYFCAGVWVSFFERLISGRRVNPTAYCQL